MRLDASPVPRHPYVHALAHKVVLIAADREDPKLVDDLREDICKFGWECQVVQGDISDRWQIRKLVCDVLDSYHDPDLPVNGRGITPRRLIRKMTDEEWLAQ